MPTYPRIREQHNQVDSIGTYAALDTPRALATRVGSQVREFLTPRNVNDVAMTAPPTISMLAGSAITSGTRNTTRVLAPLYPATVTSTGVRITGAHAWTLLGTSGPSSTTLAADAAAGATSVSWAASRATGTYLIAPPANAQITTAQWRQAEYVTVTAVTGSGPYTATLSAPLTYAHRSGDVSTTTATPSTGFSDGSGVYGSTYLTAPTPDCPSTYEVLTDAPIFEMLAAIGAATTYRVYVDGQLATASTFTAATAVNGNNASSVLSINFTVGSAAIVAATGVFTVTPIAPATGHGLAVGDRVVLGTITSTTGATAGTSYYAKTVPSATTFTLSATPGGSALSLTTDGSTTAVSRSAIRRIRVEGVNFNLSVIYTSKVDTLFDPGEPAVRSVFVGDSYQGNANGIATYIAQVLGWDARITDGIGGTGWEATNSANLGGLDGSMTARVTQILASNPDRIVVMMGLNDSNTGTLTGVVTAILTALKAGAKSTCKIVVIGPWATLTSTNATKAPVAALIKAGCDAVGIPFVSPISGGNAAPWVSGTGNSASPTGVGNSDVMLNSDNTHCTVLGLQFNSYRIASAITPYV